MADILKTLGSTATLKGGMNRTGLDPDRWLESLTHSLETYVRNGFTEIYDVQFSYPPANQRASLPKMEKTLIHFEIDVIDNPLMGFGNSIVDALYDDANVTITEIGAECHIVNFDVGIWASSKSGGVTARHRAYQHLSNLFAGPGGYNKAQQEADIEIMRFTGGSSVVEEIGEIPVFRVIGIELVTRVYGRRVMPVLPYVETTVQEPGLDISDVVIVD